MARRREISIRKGSVAECIPGKVKVENGKIVAIYRQFSDGTFEETPMKRPTNRVARLSS